MSILKSISIETIRARGAILDQDVHALRTALMAAETVAPDEADALLRLHGACPIQDPQWSALLVEIITDYIVRQAEPDGYVIAENARWLIERISNFGTVETSTELMLLVEVLEQARWTPPSLVSFSLDQVRHAIETGRGPLRAASPAPAGGVTSLDIQLISRFIKAFGSGGTLPLSRPEADALFDIHRVIDADKVLPEWQRLFVRCVGSGVLAALGHGVPSRSDVAAVAMGNERKPVVLAGGDGPRKGINIWSTMPLLSTEELALGRLERQRFEIVTNEVIEEPTDVWLMVKLGGRTTLDETEDALLGYILREASHLPESLREFATKARMAA